MTDLVIRPLTVGEEDLFEALPDPGLVGFAAFGDTYADMAAAGEYRPEWTWVAMRDGVVVARAAWWAGPEDDKPLALDWFDFTDQDAAVQLLRTAPLHAEYSLLLPTGWREDPAVRQQAESRIDAAKSAGLSPLVERYRYRWTRECGVPQRPGRLEFRPEPDDAAIFDIFRRIHRGSLDAHARRTVATSGLDAAAQEALDDLRWKPSPRDWWRVAYTRAGSWSASASPAATTVTRSSGTSESCPSIAAMDTPTTCSSKPPTCSPRRARSASWPPPTSTTFRWSPRSPEPATRSFRNASI